MKVVNLRKDKYTHYIGRGSLFGNPYKIGRDGNRKEVIKKYEIWARNSQNIKIMIGRLPENAILGCFCKPLKCHGDIIIQIWKEIHNENSK